MRAITNSEYRAHTAPLFSKLEILDIFQVNTLDTAKFMFRYHNNLLPPLFRNLFMTNSQVHRHDTRTANNYRVHSCRTNIRNSQFFTKDLESGTVFLYPFLVKLFCLEQSDRVFIKIVTKLV